MKIHIWEIAVPLILALFAAWIFKMTDRISDFLKSFFPVKLKVNELDCWYIEREEPPTHAYSHCHEYDISGEISVVPRNKNIPTEITELYLELPMGKEVIKVDCTNSPLDSTFGITPGNNIIAPFKRLDGRFSFMIRLEKKIIVPTYAYVIMGFKRGKTKHRVNLNWRGMVK